MPWVFNSTFEYALRSILLLDAFGTPQNTDMLYATDFIVVYAKTFGLADEDLNGDNQYKFSEFVSRRYMVQKALKELVLDGFVIPTETDRGINYQISKLGKKYCASLESDYARAYKAIAGKVVEYADGKSERTIISNINRLSVTSLKEDAK